MNESVKNDVFRLFVTFSIDFHIVQYGTKVTSW